MTRFTRAQLRAELVRDEGLRLKPYRDTVGKLTIGVGRNLTDRGISRAEADVLLDRDITDVVAGLDRALPWWRALTDARQRVLINMGFNLGLRGLLTFTRTLRSVEDGRYADAATQMLQSKWARQVGRRATRLAALMRAGA